MLPSATEMVYALGAGEGLVARSHECDSPQAVRGVPVCTSSKLVLDGTSYQIDARVKAILQEGLSIYRVDADRLRELRPDVIITQDQCAVCAVSLDDLEAAACDLLDPQPRLVVLHPMTLDDVFADIRKVGAAVGRAPRADALVERMKTAFDRVRERASAGSGTRPRVGIIEWLDPPMSAGNWMPTLVDIAGGTQLFGAPGRHSPWLDWQAFVQADPDVVVVVPCGFDISRTVSELGAVTTRPGWRSLSAVRSGKVFVADGNRYFNRPGPGLAESARILGQILAPDRFEPDLMGSAWIRLDDAG